MKPVSCRNITMSDSVIVRQAVRNADPTVISSNVWPWMRGSASNKGAVTAGSCPMRGARAATRLDSLR